MDEYIPHSQSPLLFSQPCGGPRKVGQDKEAAKGDEDGGGTLNDKQPLPGPETAGAVHTPCHTGRYEAGKGARYQRARVQDGGSEAQLLARVPA